MKTKFSILVALAVGSALYFSCHKQAEEADPLEGDDLVAFKGMQAAYSNAKLYNDSLMICTDSLQQIHCDNAYHNYDEQFEQHHSDYNHSHSFDDHNHDGGGMRQHDGNGMNHDNCSCCGNGSDSKHGHHEFDHTEMDKLRQRHQPYHPESK